MSHYGYALDLAEENRTEILLNLVDTHRQLGQFDQGRRLLDSALTVEGDNPSIHHALGKLERGAGQRQVALAAFERATRLDTKHSKSLIEAAELRREAGNWDAAVQAYRRALEIDGDNPRSWYGLGRSLDQLGQKGAALAYRRFLGLWATKDQRRAWVEERLRDLEATP